MGIQDLLLGQWDVETGIVWDTGMGDDWETWLGWYGESNTGLGWGITVHTLATLIPA